MPTYLDLVRQVDSSPEVTYGVYQFLSHDASLLGHILPFVAEQLRGIPWLEIDDKSLVVRISAALDGEKARSQAFAELCENLRGRGAFKVLEGWRNELYPVYNPSHNVYFVIERSAACLFGLVTYGSHINGYIPAASPRDYKFWVPRRSYQKPTWPGKLDNTVAGGLGYPLGPWETSIKECQEEAGLPSDYVESHLRGVGVVTYEFQLDSNLNTEAAVFQPEVEYIYDLVIEDGVVPKPEDGEVHEFYLMDVSEVETRLKAGEFKYNCALVYIDFLVRHGIITPENEPDYIEIVQHCHRTLEYPLR